MKGQDSADLQQQLTAFSKGDVAITELPLEDEGFWQFVFERAAHAGRSARSSRIAAAAERLIYRPLEGDADKARASAGVKALSSSDRGTRRQSVRFLHEIAPSEATLAAAANAVDDSDSEVRLEAVRLLAKDPVAKSLPALLNMLETAFDLRETLAAEALVELGADALPGLTAMLKHGDSRIRWRATRCMTKIAPEAGRGALAGLLQAFHDDSPGVAWLATDGLLALGVGVEIDVLRSVLAEHVSGTVIRSLHHYAEHASPAQIFRPLATATTGSAVGSSTLTAINTALEKLEAKR